MALLHDGSNGGEETIAVVGDGSGPNATVQVLGRADANFGSLVGHWITFGGHGREPWTVDTAGRNEPYQQVLCILEVGVFTRSHHAAVGNSCMSEGGEKDEENSEDGDAIEEHLEIDWMGSVLVKYLDWIEGSW